MAGRDGGGGGEAAASGANAASTSRDGTEEPRAFPNRSQTSDPRERLVALFLAFWRGEIA